MQNQSEDFLTHALPVHGSTIILHEIEWHLTKITFVMISTRLPTLVSTIKGTRFSSGHCSFNLHEKWSTLKMPNTLLLFCNTWQINIFLLHYNRWAVLMMILACVCLIIGSKGRWHSTLYSFKTWEEFGAWTKRGFTCRVKLHHNHSSSDLHALVMINSKHKYHSSIPDKMLHLLFNFLLFLEWVFSKS